MTTLAGLVFVLSLLVLWASLGCYSLRDFAYSRLELICDQRGRPERFREILTQQGPAMLVLKLVVTSGMFLVAFQLAAWLGWPVEPTWAAWIKSAVQYAACILAAWILVEWIPWTLGQVIGEEYLYRSWPVIHSLLIILGPLLWIVRVSDRIAHKFFGRGEPEEDDAAVIDEEIRTVVDEGRREGVLPSDAGVMIERVMELQDEDVGAIMTPRIDMLCIPVDASLEEARRQLLEGGHSRMPVIGDSTDEIMGILYAKDLLKALNPNPSPSEIIPVLRDIVREPLYVPLTTQIPALLELLKKRHVQIAIVTDEYGGVSGLVTMEDILEEIVGEIEDEYDEDIIRQRMTALSDTSADIDARVHLDDINERFGYGLPEDEEFDTIGGFVFSLAGRIPAVGETVRYKDLELTVVAADRRKVTRIRIDVIAEQTHASDNDQ